MGIGYIFVILAITVSVITIPVFAVEKGVVHGQESEPQTCEDINAQNFNFGKYTIVDDYPLISELVSRGLNEKNLENSEFLVKNYKGNILYDNECQTLYKEYKQIGKESQRWKNSCTDLGEFPNANQIREMYYTINGVCGFANLAPVAESVEDPSESSQGNEIVCGAGTVKNEKNQCVPVSETKGEPFTIVLANEFDDFKNFMPDDYDYEEFRFFESDTLKETQGNLFKENVPQYSVSIFQSFDENEIWNLHKMNQQTVKFVEEISEFAPASCYKGWKGDGELPVIRCVKNNEYFVGVTGYDKNSPNPIMKSILKKIDGSSVIPSGGCLIATATYGSELSPQVQQLRELRDNTLLQTNLGSSFMMGFNGFYYSFSPTIADWERQNPVFKEAVKLTITPLIASLSILNYVDMDSEAEILGYGISLILLNIMMYVAAPAGIGLFLRRKI